MSESSRCFPLFTYEKVEAVCDCKDMPLDSLFYGVLAPFEDLAVSAGV